MRIVTLLLTETDVILSHVNTYFIDLIIIKHIRSGCYSWMTSSGKIRKR